MLHTIIGSEHAGKERGGEGDISEEKGKENKERQMSFKEGKGWRGWSKERGGMRRLEWQVGKLGGVEKDKKLGGQNEGEERENE